ncbi:XRE family transcriptional regulator [Eubacterium sp. TM05-53]|jgi:transcriptional regulator with XRE-family HTH domain|uniref:helix-turn-helix domain-containing protein n=1 Tax=Holdemanella sp. TaxID=1971762 RepID=UPI000E4024E7|nr:helix-turn-helix transcriptional regulator [Holdemanella sp.]RGJ66579.1 XRE family transcriptional regulator [Eubacterium sp. TM05-53]
MYLKRIRDLREDNDLTQTEVAKYLRISQQYYSNIEKGERTISVDIICMLADYYKVSTDYLLNRTDIKKPF